MPPKPMGSQQPLGSLHPTRSRRTSRGRRNPCLWSMLGRSVVDFVFCPAAPRFADSVGWDVGGRHVPWPECEQNSKSEQLLQSKFRRTASTSRMWRPCGTGGSCRGDLRKTRATKDGSRVCQAARSCAASCQGTPCVSSTVAWTRSSQRPRKRCPLPKRFGLRCCRCGPYLGSIWGRACFCFTRQGSIESGSGVDPWPIRGRSEAEPIWDRSGSSPPSVRSSAKLNRA